MQAQKEKFELKMGFQQPKQFEFPAFDDSESAFSIADESIVNNKNLSKQQKKNKNKNNKKAKKGKPT